MLRRNRQMNNKRKYYHDPKWPSWLGCKIHQLQEKIFYQMYMDDIKLFAKKGKNGDP